MDGSSNNLVFGFRTVDLKDVCTIIQWQIVKCSSQLASNGECVTSMRTHKMTQSVTYCISTFLTCCSLNFSELACTDSENLLTLKHCECTFWDTDSTVNAQTIRTHSRSNTFPIFCSLWFSYSISALFLYFGRKCVQLRKYSRIQLSFTISHVHSSKWCRNKWKGAFSLQIHPIEEYLNRSIGTRLLFDRSCVSVLHSTKTWDTYNAWTIISKWPLNEYWTYIHMISLDQTRD